VFLLFFWDLGIYGKERQKLEELKEAKTETMKVALDKLKDELIDFTRNNQKKILQDPLFRLDFHCLCAQCNIDPISSGKNVFSCFGVGKFYYELSIQVVDICYSTRNQNGGIIPMTELQRLLENMRQHKDKITVNDIMRAITKIKILNSGYSVFKVGNQIVVKSVPTAFNEDNKLLIELAQIMNGHFGKSDIIKRYLWDEDRITRALDNMLKEGYIYFSYIFFFFFFLIYVGVIMIDTQSENKETQYWVVGLLSKIGTRAGIASNEADLLSKTFADLEKSD
jgi:ESCRT-II complex subunit VPS22